METTSPPETAKAPVAAPVTAPPPTPAPVVPAASGVPVRGSRGETIKTLVIMLVAASVLGMVFAVSLGWEIPGFVQKSGRDDKKNQDAPLKVELVKDEKNPKVLTHTLSVPEEVRTSLHIRQNNVDIMGVAKPPSSGLTMELPGSTALNPARIARIRIRFPTNGTEVVSVGKRADNLGSTTIRELRPGDTVTVGQELATFYSIDVGSKKNDLIDAICQLKLDQEIYNRAIASDARGAVPEVFILNSLRALAADVNAVNRAVRTLETWSVPPEDIKAIRDEAEEISKLLKPGEALRPPVNPEREKQWGMVTLKSPISGVIIERNIGAEKEIIVDNTINLFQIVDVSDLLVLANAPEDQLQRLREIKEEQGLNWSVRTAGAPPKTGSVGPVDEIGYLIDQNTHTAILKGFIKNEKRAMRSGQYVTARIELPKEKHVVEIPMAAIADDGRQTVVFIQPDASKPNYTMTRVKVTHRFDKIAYVSTVLTDEDVALSETQVKEQGMLPLSTLKEGDRVLISGILELKKELDDRESAILDTGKP